MKRVIKGYLINKPIIDHQIVKPSKEVPSGDNYIAIDTLEIAQKQYPDMRYKVKVTIEFERIQIDCRKCP